MSRHTRHILAGLIMTAALLSAGGTRLEACSCIGSSEACEAVWTTDAVFVATVVTFGPEIEIPRTIGTSTVTARDRIVKLKVTEVFRGIDVGDVEVRTSSGSCRYDFKPQGTYLVFAYRGPDSDLLSVSSCSKTAPIEHAAADLAYLRGPFRQPAELGVIRGVVRRQEPGFTPNEGTHVSPFGGAQLRLEGYAQAYNTVSAADGAYQFRVPAGDYQLLVRVRDGVYSWPGPEGHPLTLRDNRGCVVADVSVRPDSRIAGRLLDTAGRPVPFMSIDLAPTREIRSDWVWTTTQALTDERGRFEFSRIDPGQYAPGLTLKRDKTRAQDFVVWLSADGGGLASPVTVASEARIDIGDVRLPSSVGTLTLLGVVVDTNGRPVQAANVRFRSANPDGYVNAAPTVTDHNGRFSLSVLAGRAYRIAAEWRASSPGAVRYLTAESDPFEAVGDLKPFRLVLSEAR